MNAMQISFIIIISIIGIPLAILLLIGLGHLWVGLYKAFKSLIEGNGFDLDI